MQVETKSANEHGGDVDAAGALGQRRFREHVIRDDSALKRAMGFASLCPSYANANG